MLSLIPEEMFAAALQLACYCFVAFTAVVACLFAPRA